MPWPLLKGNSPLWCHSGREGTEPIPTEAATQAPAESCPVLLPFLLCRLLNTTDHCSFLGTFPSALKGAFRTPFSASLSCRQARSGHGRVYCHCPCAPCHCSQSEPRVTDGHRKGPGRAQGSSGEAELPSKAGKGRSYPVLRVILNSWR